MHTYLGPSEENDILSPPSQQDNQDSENISEEKSLSSSSPSPKPSASSRPWQKYTKSPRPLLTLYVQIGQQKEESIEVYPGDTAAELAREFTLKHKLLPEQERMLTEKFDTEMKEALIPTFSTAKNLSKHSINQTNMWDHKQYFDKEDGNKNMEEVEKVIKDLLKREASKNLSLKTSSTMKLKENMGPTPQKERNHGLVMYSNWLKARESMERYRNEMKQEKERDELRGVTFKPEINERRRQDDNKDNNTRYEERLLEYARKMKLKHDRNKSMMITEELEKCSFHPTIRPSRNFSTVRARSAHVRCYSCSAYSRKNAPANYECTFSPNAKRDTSSNAKKSSPCRKSTPVEFMTRSGHKQVISRASDLASHNRQKSFNGNNSSASTQFAEKRKIEGFKIVFELLDRDGDGLISSNSIDVSRLPKKLIEMYSPLLSDLQNFGESLNLGQFIMVAKNLYATLNVTDRNSLIPEHHSKTEFSPCEFPFQPRINGKSRQLSSKSAATKADETAATTAGRKSSGILSNQSRLTSNKQSKSGKYFSQCVFRTNNSSRRHIK